MIKAVFFDLDNTLCDSDTAWNIAVRDTFQILHKHYPDVSKEHLLRTWLSVLKELFQGLDAGKCSMAEVRDLRFYRLFEKLNLSQDKLTEELSNSLCQRYITSLKLYEDAGLFSFKKYQLMCVTGSLYRRSGRAQRNL